MSQFIPNAPILRTRKQNSEPRLYRVISRNSQKEKQNKTQDQTKTTREKTTDSRTKQDTQGSILAFTSTLGPTKNITDTKYSNAKQLSLPFPPRGGVWNVTFKDFIFIYA
jgi:hypothetical protein